MERESLVTNTPLDHIWLQFRSVPAQLRTQAMALGIFIIHLVGDVPGMSGTICSSGCSPTKNYYVAHPQKMVAPHPQIYYDGQYGVFPTLKWKIVTSMIAKLFLKKVFSMWKHHVGHHKIYLWVSYHCLLHSPPSSGVMMHCDCS